jgi:hypothetical protein
VPRAESSAGLDSGRGPASVRGGSKGYVNGSHGRMGPLSSASLTTTVETPKQGTLSWHRVASHLPGRNNKDCRKRWHYAIANTIRKGTWTEEEDDRLREAVKLYGGRWSRIAEVVGTRNGDQCWKRWYDCLDPRIDKSPWTAEDVSYPRKNRRRKAAHRFVG